MSDVDDWTYETERDTGILDKAGIRQGDFVAYKDGDRVGSNAVKSDLQRDLSGMDIKAATIIKFTYPSEPEPKRIVRHPMRVDHNRV